MGMGPDHIAKAIDEEVQSRIDGDVLLDEKIDAEAEAHVEVNAKLQGQIDALNIIVEDLENVSHRGDWTYIGQSSTVAPGEMSCVNGDNWPVARSFRVSKIDMADTSNTFLGVEEGGIVRLQISGERGAIVGEGIYEITNVNNSDPLFIYFDGIYIRHSGESLTPNDIVHITLTPVGGTQDALTKDEADKLYLQLNAASTNVALLNGTSKSQSDFLLKGSGTSIQLVNGTSVAQSSFASSSHTHNYASSSHSHSYASTSHTHSYASTNHSHGPGTFTSSGSTLYWTP